MIKEIRDKWKSVGGRGYPYEVLDGTLWVLMSAEEAENFDPTTVSANLARRENIRVGIEVVVATSGEQLILRRMEVVDQKLNKLWAKLNE